MAVQEFPQGLIAFGLLCLAVFVAWYGALRRGAVRAVGLAVGAVAFVAAILLVIERPRGGDHPDRRRTDLRPAPAREWPSADRAHLRPAPAPDHPVLIFNPKSGGGKAERSRSQPRLGHAASSRSSSRRARTSSRSCAMRSPAARTGSRWPAATARRQSSPRSLPSSISRTHAFRRGRVTTSPSTSGVDRDDVVGALDAFVNGRERQVDLGDVNGRVFVNNVSLGRLRRGRPAFRLPRREAAYAARHGARRSGAVRIGARPHWTGPDGHEHHSGAVILVSNNRYRLGRAVGSGTRPAIDDGLVGIAIVGAPTGRGEGGRAPQRPVRQWSAPTFEVRAERPVPAGNRRRGGATRAAAAVLDPVARAESPHRTSPSRRLALGAAARGLRRQLALARANRGRA